MRDAPVIWRVSCVVISRCSDRDEILIMFGMLSFKQTVAWYLRSSTIASNLLTLECLIVKERRLNHQLTIQLFFWMGGNK